MTQNELIALRKKILDDMVPLAIDGVENSPDRFELLLRIIQSGSVDGSIFEKAYETAKAIEDKDEKLSALMALVDEIDFTVGAQSDADEPAPEPEQPIQAARIPVATEDTQA